MSAGNATPFLTNLGISAIQQQRNPVATQMPSAFNPSTGPTWAQVVNDLVLDKNVTLNWGNAINNFVLMCEALDKYPFSNERQTSNDRIFQHLIDCRRDIVKFFNNSEILSQVVLRSTTRNCQMVQNGFVLSVSGSIELKDPTFSQWLLAKPYPGFALKHDNRYSRELNRFTHVWVANEKAGGSLRWTLGYDITCPTYPDLPGSHVPSADDLERFVSNVLWVPVMKTQRPRGFHRRLI